MLGLIILAGGKGTRLKADKPKCMYKIGQRPMIDYVLDNFKVLDPKQIVLVVGYKKEILINYLGKKYNYVWQKQLLGTAHAVKTGLKKISKNIKTVLVTNSDDAVFYKKETLKKFLENFYKKNLNFSFLVVRKKKPPRVNRVLGKNGLELINPKNKSFKIVCGAYLKEIGLKKI